MAGLLRLIPELHTPRLTVRLARPARGVPNAIPSWSPRVSLASAMSTAGATSVTLSPGTAATRPTRMTTAAASGR